MVSHLTTLSLLVLQLCFHISEQQVFDCPDGWVYFRGSCYMFAENTKRDWTEASQFCFFHHRSNLVTIDNADENAFIKGMCQRLSRGNEIHTAFFTAASDSDTEGVWQWFPDNIPLSGGFTNWHPGQPEDFSTDHDQDCMILYGETGFDWHDGSCGYPRSIICELK